MIRSPSNDSGATWATDADREVSPSGDRAEEHVQVSVGRRTFDGGGVPPAASQGDAVERSSLAGYPT